MTNPGVSELLEASDHIRYEVWMLTELAPKLSRFPPAHDAVLYNAMLESFLVHMRNLTHFFRDKPAKGKDDIVVSDYLSEANLQLVKLAEGDELLDLAEQANKRVSHLTYSRLRMNDIWLWNRVANLLGARMVMFVELADARILHADLYEWRRHYRPSSMA